MPNTEVIEKWVEALESGEYQQGTGYLHRKLGEEDVFCCLGVLCDLAVKEKAVPKPGIEGPVRTYGALEKTGALPSEVSEWAGFEDSYVPLRTPASIAGTARDVPLTLISLNDTYGLSFRQIAEVIRSNFL